MSSVPSDPKAENNIHTRENISKRQTYTNFGSETLNVRRVVSGKRTMDTCTTCECFRCPDFRLLVDFGTTGNR